MRIGVEMDGSFLRLAIVDGGQVYRKIVVPTKASEPKEVIIAHMIEMIKKIFNSNIRGIGIGLSGIVNQDEGFSKKSINISHWEDVPIKDILEKEFEVPVFVNNDCNCFAFGERYYGEGTMCKDIVSLTLSLGVGAGVIINNELYYGNSAGAGEIGFLNYLDANYEYYCGQRFFIRNNTTGQEAYELAMKGDACMIGLWKEIGGHIGNLINTVLFTYDPQAVILGGDLAIGYDFFKQSMYDNIAQFPFKDTLNRVKILLSKKEDVTLIGAASLVV